MLQPFNSNEKKNAHIHNSTINTTAISVLPKIFENKGFDFTPKSKSQNDLKIFIYFFKSSQHNIDLMRPLEECWRNLHRSRETWRRAVEWRTTGMMREEFEREACGLTTMWVSLEFWIRADENMMMEKKKKKMMMVKPRLRREIERVAGRAELALYRTDCRLRWVPPFRELGGGEEGCLNGVVLKLIETLPF